MSVTTPAGFAATGIAAGIKGGDRPDLAVVSNLGPRFAAAGVFTRNRVFAAPVDWSRRAVADGRLCAVVLNSGGANACTGRPGFADARAMAEKTAAGLGVAAGDVAVCSTGLIGVRLPMPEVTSGIEQACAQLSLDGGDDAATAIMTTDTVSKQAVHRGEGWSIGGMAKGAGMLAPGLATMLVILTTDADLEAPVLDAALREASRVSFERADADGCMSTNDTVLLLASGASGITPEAQEFTAALSELCQNLARQLIADAEGAGHEIAIEVVGAASVRDAETVGREVARSNLFKCAVFGCDPNWGRVLSAIGVTDAVFEADRLDVSFNGVQVCRGGGIGEPRELVDLSGRKVHVLIDLHAGEAAATILTTDLTYEYVKENAEYSS
ncbi:bifunctional glutamate N-acetyltransferase/amino-acid acetyltransferase ArgJ [Arachnia propionica]|uniref:Arginine biosynthesis bifunctional protein ArgJ n=1 Tax=Arachnia propionica TaxID=1750 RepID=A0A3S4VJT6_9ACTN|nr:bifunctional glutamate N-acetyltransferase/amino-acid acetyltransferase ArgJ [Arachnia propionica]QUC13135.1 bifunctional glutamate N-acetyltransferase/amino-acid acetyltransferase ArgJ [Arachnia propionica]VEH70668.1 Glutamate N-acetyltransferase [Arachnia propionica]